MTASQGRGKFQYTLELTYHLFGKIWLLKVMLPTYLKMTLSYETYLLATQVF